MTKRCILPLTGALLVLLLATAGLGAMIALRLADGITGASLSAAAFLLSILLILMWCRNYQKEQQQVREHFRVLCDLSPERLSDPHWEDQLPPLERDSEWSHLSQQLRHRLVSYWEQLQQLKQACTGLEIRARQAASQAEYIRQLFASLEEPVLIVNKFEELQMANPAAEKLLSRNGKPLAEQELKDLFQSRRVAEVVASAARRYLPVPRHEELELVDAEERKLSFRATIASLAENKDGHVEPAGAVVVLRPVSQEKEIRKQHAEFVSAVAHEMKTPLASIRAYVELLADGDVEDEETREEFLQVINGQVDRLQRLIDNMLNLARIEAGVVKVEKRNMSLNEILEEAADVVQPTAAAKQITFTSDLSPLYLGVFIDRDLMLQAVINLLSNAVKYTPEGGRVTLRSRLTDEAVVFEVQDTGVGMSEEDCKRVFERFYRVKQHEKMAAGTGLGLALVKYIVEDVHGGKIHVESKLGEGSTFVVELPPSREIR